MPTYMCTDRFVYKHAERHVYSAQYIAEHNKEETKQAADSRQNREQNDKENKTRRGSQFPVRHGTLSTHTGSRAYRAHRAYVPPFNAQVKVFCFFLYAWSLAMI